MFSPRHWVLTAAAALVLMAFAAPLTVEAQRTSSGRGSSLRGSGGSAAPAPAPSGGSTLRGSSARPAPAPAPSPSGGGSVRSSGSRGAAPAPGATQITRTPSRSSQGSSTMRGSSTPAAGGSSSPSVRSSSGSSYRSSGSTSPSARSVPGSSSGSVARTSSGVPTIRSSSSSTPRSTSSRAPESSTLRSRSSASRAEDSSLPRSTLSRGDNISRTSNSREAATVAPRATENRSSLRGSQSNLRSAGQPTGGTYSERSTLTSFRTSSSGSSTFRATTSAHSSLGVRTTVRTQSYYSPSYYYSSGWSSGVGFSWYLGGGFSISFGTGWRHGGWNWCGYPGHNHRHWGSNVYYGSFAMAYVVGSACHIVPYHGYWGYRHGTHCYWMPHHQYGRCHSFWYGGNYCRVSRPYWYDYWAWYDWRPYRYGFSTLVYDSLYDEGYDDGYDRGYSRGYENGADDASGLRDDRRRDRIGGERTPRPEPELDRAGTDASAEYRYQLEHGLASVTRGDHEAATRAFKEAAVLAPESADARYLLSVSAFAQGKYALSAFALRRAVKLDAAGRNLDLPRIFGNPEVIRTYRERLQAELQKHPTDEDLLLVQGFVALRMGDAKTAAAALDAALQESPEDAAVKLLQKEALDALDNE